MGEDISFDLKIQNPCDHRLALERAALEGDFITVRAKHFIASTSNFELYRFGKLVDKSRYSIVAESDPEFVFLHPKKVIKFKLKERVNKPLYELSYITINEDCPKCSGVKFLDDPVLDSNGDFKKVRDEALLAQFVEKYIVTELASNKYHKWVGTGLVNLTSMKIQDVSFITLKVKEEVLKTLDNLKETQKQQAATSQEVSRGELLDRVLNIDVSRSDKDPTIFNVSVEYKSVRGAALEFIQAIELSQFRQRVFS